MYATVRLRGEEYGVEYHDHGYEPDTNAWEIDWVFEGGGPDFELTDDDWEEVMTQLYERARDDVYYGEF